METLLIVIGVILLLGLLYAGRGYWAWIALTTAVLLAWLADGIKSHETFTVAAVVALAFALLFGISMIRRTVVSSPLTERP